MANKILLKRSAVPGKAPSLVDLSAGEMGLNTVDAKVYFSTGAVVKRFLTEDDAGGYQPAAASLYNLVLSGDGILTKSGESIVPREIQGSAALTVTHGNGVLGNPSLDLSPSGVLAGTYPKVAVDSQGRVTAGYSLSLTDVTSALGFTPENAALKGVASGYTPLDATGKVPVSFLPASVTGGMNYQGVWNALTNTPTITSGTGSKGFYYKVSTAGASVVDGNTNWTVGDLIVFNGTIWDKLEGGSPDVSSVNGLVGAVSITTITGNAGSSSVLQTARTISLGSDVTGSASFNGGANVTITATLAASGVTAGTYNNSATSVQPYTVDTKGRITSVGAAVPITPAWASLTGRPSTISGFGITDHSLSNCTDVTVTAPGTNHLLMYNGTRWVNSSLNAGSYSVTLGTWTPIGGGLYTATVTHNLNTSNFVLSLFNEITGEQIQADSTKILTSNSVLITVASDTYTLRCTIIATGQSFSPLLPNVLNSAQVVNKGGAPSLQEGVAASRPAFGLVGSLFLATDTKVLYRDTGSAWEVILASQGALRSLSFYASSLDSPNTSDFAVNALAPSVSDSLNTGINVRSFSDTVEQGVSVVVPVPQGAVTMTLRNRGRPQVVPATQASVQPSFYLRKVAPGAGPMSVGAWSAAQDMNVQVIPTNAFFQYNSQTFSIEALGFTGGDLIQLELTRKTGIVTNLAGAWLLLELTVEFN